MNSNTITNVSLSQLIDRLGYISFNIWAYLAGIPVIGVLGLILCSINACILFRKVFRQPEYVYYRMITLIFILHLVLSIPYGICYTPLYMPLMDMQACSTLRIVYIPFSNLSFHFTAVLEIAVLFERMKNFSPLIKKYFTRSPLIIALALFVVCFAVDFFFSFVYVPSPGFNFYFFDSGGVKRQGTLYIMIVSKLATSPYGFMGVVSVYIVRDLFTLIVSVTLNIVSLIQLRRYIRKKEAILKSPLSSNHIATASSSGKLTKIIKSSQKSQMTENSLLFMVVILCSISIVTRLTLIACNMYYLFYVNSISYILSAVINLVLVMGPASSFFVFYSFNKVFRSEFFKMLKKIFAKKIG